jgi:putative FmdB family regulatory protein
MPIYAYRCSACGHAKDVLQKMSDPLLSVCPACGQSTFVKQVTAAGFQLKGSGWYVTDFREGQKGGQKPNKDAADTAGGGAAQAKSAEASSEKATDKGASSADAAAPAAAKPADAPSPAPAPTAKAAAPSPSSS